MPAVEGVPGGSGGPVVKGPVETLIQTLFEGLDLSTLDEEEFVRVFFEVIEEGERRDLLATGCSTHDFPSIDKFPVDMVDAWDRGEDPCTPVVWVLKP